MSKTSFRARALDPTTPLPIHLGENEDLSEIPEYMVSNRALPEMPTGMEKEEEAEFHLQQAIRRGLIIPTPQVATTTNVLSYENMYGEESRQPKLIRWQILSLFNDKENLPEYDIDTEDENWLKTQTEVPYKIPELKFEEIMDTLETHYGVNVLSFEQAKSLLDNDEVSNAIFKYWMTKRLRLKHRVHPTVKSDNTGTKTKDSYVIFRKHSGRVRTRKGRKNNEANYEKMLLLKKDLQTVKEMLELVRSREFTKKHLLLMTKDIYEKRYEVGDFDGSILADIQSLKVARPPLVPMIHNQHAVYRKPQVHHKVHHRRENKHPRSEKDQTTKETVKRKIILKIKGLQQQQSENVLQPADINVKQVKRRRHLKSQYSFSSSDENAYAISDSQQSKDSPFEDQESSDDSEFPFQRKKNCSYFPSRPGVFTNWPLPSRGAYATKYPFVETSLHNPVPKYIGLARRRVGRGGRVVLDRYSEDDDMWSSCDFTVFKSNSIVGPKSEKILYHPKPLPVQEFTSCEDYESDSGIEEASETTEPQPVKLFPTEAASIRIDFELEGLSNSNSQIKIKKKDPFSSEFNISDYFPPSSSEELGFENINLISGSGW